MREPPTILRRSHTPSACSLQEARACLPPSSLQEARACLPSSSLQEARASLPPSNPCPIPSRVPRAPFIFWIKRENISMRRSQSQSTTIQPLPHTIPCTPGPLHILDKKGEHKHEKKPEPVYHHPTPAPYHPVYP